MKLAILGGGGVRMPAFVRAVLASSSSEMSTLARLGVRRDSVRLIPRGVDTGTFNPEGPDARVRPRGAGQPGGDL